MKYIETAEPFVRELWHQYLEDNNYAALGTAFADQFSIIGTGSHEVSRNRDDFTAMMMQEENQRSSTFTIIDQWYQFTPLSDSLLLVIGELQVRENSPLPLVYECRFRITMLLQQLEEEWKILHVHQSAPDPGQADDEFFPHRLIEQSNVQLQKLVEEKTRELEESNRQMQYNLRHDYLTGLLNRRTLELEIEHRMIEHGSGALLMLDVDEFKEINDHYGHPSGDQTLETLGAAIQEVFGIMLTGRVGGDEFVLYLDGAQPEQSEQIEKQIRQMKVVWEQNRKARGMTFDVSFSLGVAFCPAQGQDYSGLWAKADQALYRAKAAGRSVVCFCGDEDQSCPEIQ